MTGEEVGTADWLVLIGKQGSKKFIFIFETQGLKSIENIKLQGKNSELFMDPHFQKRHSLSSALAFKIKLLFTNSLQSSLGKHSQGLALFHGFIVCRDCRGRLCKNLSASKHLYSFSFKNIAQQNYDTIMTY